MPAFIFSHILKYFKDVYLICLEDNNENILTTEKIVNDSLTEYFFKFLPSNSGMCAHTHKWTIINWFI